jgi:predicted alpha/beta-fold hydrolase
MINHFKRDMPRPIVGIGHSLGAGQLLVTLLSHGDVSHQNPLAKLFVPEFFCQ